MALQKDMLFSFDGCVHTEVHIYKDKNRYKENVLRLEFKYNQCHNHKSVQIVIIDRHTALRLKQQLEKVL